MLYRLARCYRVPKPRVMTANDWSLVRYRQLMRDTRRRIHIEANTYQERIQEQYLEERREKTAQRHRENEQRFRTQIVCNGYLLSKDMERWKKDDDARDERLQGFVHREQLKKLNRDRILKILAHESENYWFNEDNLEERLVDNTIFPEEVGSTEYYHKLTEQSLAYESFDFERLEDIESDEAAIKHKNKTLVPLYNNVLKLIKEVKANPYRQNESNYIHQQNEINRLYEGKLFAEERARKLQEAKAAYESIKEQLLQDMESQLKRDEFIKEKLLQIRKLLAYWKKYSDVLNLTSAEIRLHNLSSKNLDEIKIDLSNFEKGVQTKGTTATPKDVFMSAKEKNTSEEEVELEKFYEEGQPKETSEQTTTPSTAKLEKLDALLDSTNLFDDELSEKKKYPEHVGVGDKDMAARMNIPVPDIELEEKERFKDNTSVMIETWKKLTRDPELLKLLDQVGELPLEQAQLFWKVWETQ